MRQEMEFWDSSGISWTISLYTTYTSLKRKAELNICPLPADVRDSCFRGGAGVRRGKSASVGQQPQQ